VKWVAARLQLFRGGREFELVKRIHRVTQKMTTYAVLPKFL